MSQYKDMIDEARELLNSKTNNIPSMTSNFADPDDSWLLSYPCGKVVKTYKDKRKKDLVIQESYI